MKSSVFVVTSKMRNYLNHYVEFVFVGKMIIHYVKVQQKFYRQMSRKSNLMLSMKKLKQQLEQVKQWN